MSIDSVTIGCVKNASDEEAIKQGCRFNEKRALKVRRFFRDYCRHSKGEFAGQPFELLDWQYENIIAPVFGWLRPDGTRRFRTSYNLVPKKNGKSTLCSGISLYLLTADKEPGAEIYNLACDRNQASIVFNEALNMAEASEVLSSLLYPVKSKKELHFRESHSFLKALSADAKTKEGFNIHGCVCDETHAWPSDNKLWNAVKYGGAARRQPLFIHITTAGLEKFGLWWDLRNYTEQVNNSEIIDTTHHGVIYEASETDNPEDELTWFKANPSLGITMRVEDFRSDMLKAKQKPTEWASFLRYRLNLCVSNAIKWVDIAKWDACSSPLVLRKLRRKRCYVGFDLSSTTDIAGFVLFFPKYRAFVPFAFVPRERLRERVRENKTRLDRWVEEGFIIATDGSVIDYDVIMNTFYKVTKPYLVQSVAFDPWNATHMMNKLAAKGYDVYECRQGFPTLSEPMKLMETWILEGKVNHFANPVLRWCVNNMVAATDPNNNVRPMKNKAVDKIDLAVASIMSIAAFLQKQENRASVYDTRGVAYVHSAKGNHNASN